ncbi:MAG: hypothetical protein ACO3E1_10650 [Flavobacteriales bacterium]
MKNYLFYLFLFLAILQKSSLAQNQIRSDSASCISADSLRALYNQKVLYLGEGNHFYLNDEKIRLGIFAKNLRKELEKYPEAYKLYKEGKHLAAISVSMYCAGLLGIVSTIIFPPSLAVFIPTIIISSATAYSSIYLMSSAGKKISKSIWIRNREALVR